MKHTFLLVTMFFAVVLTAGAGNYNPSLDTSFCTTLTGCSGPFTFAFADLNPAYTYQVVLTDVTNPATDNTDIGNVTASAPTLGPIAFLNSGDEYEITLVEFRKNGNLANKVLVDVTFTVQ